MGYNIDTKYKIGARVFIDDERKASGRVVDRKAAFGTGDIVFVEYTVEYEVNKAIGSSKSVHLTENELDEFNETTPVKLYKIEAYILDVSEYFSSADDLVNALHHVSGPNHCLDGLEVKGVDTVEIHWHDNHPLNTVGGNVSPSDYFEDGE